MNKEIILEWDEEKRQRNITERDIDFEDAIDVFFDPNMQLYLDKRRDYGEERLNAYGLSKNRRLRVCFTLRGEIIRIITIFKVHKKEWDKRYGG
jgi:uncharacterized DUF497 family protein